LHLANKWKALNSHHLGPLKFGKFPKLPNFSTIQIPGKSFRIFTPRGWNKSTEFLISVNDQVDVEAAEFYDVEKHFQTGNFFLLEKGLGKFHHAFPTHV